MSPLPRRFAVFLPMAALAAILAQGPFDAAVTRLSPYLTRAEAAAIVVIASSERQPTPSARHPYVDVLPTDWFAPSLLAAAERGIVSPDATGTRLRPFGSVNRAAFLKMLTIAFKLPLRSPHAFADVPSDAWYAPYAGVAQTYRLFSHADPSKLEPDRLVTQDEARTALQVFLQLRSKAEEEEAKRAAIAQASGKVQLYTVISTKRLRVVLVADKKQQLSAIPEAKPAPEHVRYAAPASAAARTAAQQSPLAAPKTADDIRAEVLVLVNMARANAGLGPLARNAALERSAQAYADQMHREGFFGHTDPKGKSLKDRVDAVQYYTQSFSADCQCIKGYALGENLARGQRSAEDVVRAWLESPSHRDAILGPDFQDLGVGIQSGVWVQHFGGVLTPQTR